MYQVLLLPRAVRSPEEGNETAKPEAQNSPTSSTISSIRAPSAVWGHSTYPSAPWVSPFLLPYFSCTSSTCPSTKSAPPANKYPIGSSLRAFWAQIFMHTARSGASTVGCRSSFLSPSVLLWVDPRLQSTKNSDLRTCPWTLNRRLHRRAGTRPPANTRRARPATAATLSATHT